ncbi:MAG: diguanylate cyclase domain-containing protein [Actinomycetota bacterium]
MRGSPTAPSDECWSAAQLTRLADLIASSTNGRLAFDDLDATLEQVAESARNLFDVDTVSISRVEPESGLVRTLLNVGQLSPQETRRPTDELYTVQESPHLVHLIQTSRSWSIALDDEDAPEPELALLKHFGRSAAAAAAIPVEGRVWGEFYVSRCEGQRLNSVDVALLEVVAAHLGAVLTVWAEAERQFTVREVDTLTGLPLRAAAENAVLDHREAVTVAALDVNGLKEINDSYGHAAGDRLLQTVGAILGEVKKHRTDAVVSRVGGDEFVIVVPGTDVSSWMGTLQAALDEVSTIPHAGISCGIATSADLHAGIGSGRSLFRLADAALYRAKRTRATRPFLSSEREELPHRMGRPPQAEHIPTFGRPGSFAHVHLREAVNAFSRVVNAAGWWISSLAPDSEHFVVRDRRVIRDSHHDDDVEVAPIGDAYVAVDFPDSLRVVEGGYQWVGLHDLDSAPEEQQLLAEMGFAGNLMAGMTTPDGVRWLVEVMCDEETAAIDRMGPQLLGMINSVGYPHAEDLAPLHAGPWATGG